MKKNDLISKWLDHDLTKEELEAFKNLDASGSYQRITEAAKHFASPTFDPETSYANFSKPEQVKKRSSLLPYVWRVAAVFAIALGTYFAFFNNQDQSFIAENAQRIEVTLPDASEVILNADSQLSFDENNWKNSRDLSLNGEAYFKVAKGSKFTVHTEMGDVSVLGTQFNVKSRDGLFEVTCFEGLVRVDFDGSSVKLPATHTFRWHQGEVLSGNTESIEPDWIGYKSIFKSIEFSEVLEELERQYNISVVSEGIETDIIYTGSFSHENLETALQAITIPLNLTFEIDGDKVTLTKDE